MINYVLDTNVMLNNFKEILETFKDCGLMIPMTVVKELDRQKTLDGELGYKARSAIRELFAIKKYGNLTDWLKLTDNVSIKVEENIIEDLHLDYKCNDDDILGTLAYSNRKYGKSIMVSNDLALCLKAEGLGYESMQIDAKKDLYKNVYKGKREIEVEDWVIDNFYQLDLHTDYIKEIPYENEFVILKSNINPKKTAIGICVDGKIEKPKYFDYKPSGVTPRNAEQKMAIELLMRDEIPMVTFTGKYGAAKSYLQLAVAIDKLNSNKFNRILLIKPPIPLDKNLMVGYKPGDVFSKYLNTLGSITSNLEALKEDKRDKYMNGVKILEGYITQGLMEIISIEDILGSSYNNCIILAEEMQLLTKENMEALVSRVGNSRIFLNGDLKQGSRMINKDPREMGLFHLIDVFKDSKLAGHLNLQSIQRSPFVSELAERW